MFKHSCKYVCTLREGGGVCEHSCKYVCVRLRASTYVCACICVCACMCLRVRLFMLCACVFAHIRKALAIVWCFELLALACSNAKSAIINFRDCPLFQPRKIKKSLSALSTFAGATVQGRVLGGDPGHALPIPASGRQMSDVRKKNKKHRWSIFARARNHTKT